METNTMPTLKVTTEDPESLIQDPENVRTHPARNLDAIRRSIKRFGVRRPIVAREGSRIVYAGNGVLQAAIALKLTEIPVAWIPEEVSETVARAYAIADNQTGVLSAWDTPKLGAALEELNALDFDLIDMGFDDEAIRDSGLLISNEFQSFDESLESEPDETIICPECGHTFTL
jgi:ParB-like chromosome segregation protein Spo0J